MTKNATLDLSDLDLFPNEKSEHTPRLFAKFAGATIDSETNKVTARPKKRKVMAATVFNKARAETQAMISSGDWEACTSRHLVALYDLMHIKVYGIESGMSSSDRHTASMIAGGFTKREFDGDVAPVVDYLRWLWTREMGREKWRRENHREGARLTIGACFSGNLLTDYRLHLTRQR